MTKRKTGRLTSSDQVKYSTRIVWHDRLNGDVESQWLRSIFVAYARPIAGDVTLDDMND